MVGITSTALEMRKYLSGVHKIVGTHVQRINNHFAKYEYKQTKTIGVTDYTKLDTILSILNGKKMSLVQDPQKLKNIHEMCTK